MYLIVIKHRAEAVIEALDKEREAYRISEGEKRATSLKEEALAVAV